MTKKGLIRLVAVIIAISMPLMTAISATAETEYNTTVKYESPDVNVLSGLGEEPLVHEIFVSGVVQQFCRGGSPADVVEVFRLAL